MQDHTIGGETSNVDASLVVPGVTFMVLIGTNNLGAHFDVASTVKGIKAVVTWLLEHTQGAVGCIGKETGKACVFHVW